MIFFSKTFAEELPKDKPFVIFENDYILLCKEVREAHNGYYDVTCYHTDRGSRMGRYANSTTKWCYVDDMKNFLNDVDFGEPHDPWSD